MKKKLENILKINCNLFDRKPRLLSRGGGHFQDNFMYKLGLKLWSTNKNYVKEAKRLYEEGLYSYIELFAVPDSFKDYINLWEELDVPYVIHAAHSAVGLNLAKKEFFKQNMRLAGQARLFADELKADIIIFHPGLEGKIEETANQLNKIKDQRIIVENKPYYGLYDNLTCNGNSPEEIKFVLDNVKVGFCLDIGHTIYSANAQNKDWFLYLKEFLSLNPKIFHISDGDKDGVYDQHKNLGKGSFDFEKIFSLTPKNSLISIETKKNFENSLKDFEEDVCFIKQGVRL